MTDYESRVRDAIVELKEVFDSALPEPTIDIVKVAGKNLAANIAQHPEVDLFSAAAALYELCLIDTNAFFITLMEGTEDGDAAAAHFLAESPKMLAQLYAAISLLN